MDRRPLMAITFLLCVHRYSCKGRGQGSCHIHPAELPPIVASAHLLVEKLCSGEPVLVVLDVMLPGMQGFEVLRQICAQSHIPVLMLTAQGGCILTAYLV